MDLLDVEPAEAAEAVVRRPQRLGVGRELGHHLERGVEPRAHGVGQLGERLGSAVVDREVLGQVLVDLPQRLAQAGRLGGEVTAGLVGVQVGLDEQVAGAGQRQVPAVAGGAQELLEHRELHGRAGLLLGLGIGLPVDPVQPAVERCDVVGPGVGQHLVHPDVRVHPGRDLAEHLHQAVLAERDRGVRLLTGEQRGVRGEVEVVPGQPVEPQPAVVVAEVAARLARRPVERAQPAVHGVAVVEGVVRVHPAVAGLVPPPDEGVVEPGLRVGVEGHRHLVELAAARPVAVDDLDQLDHDAGAGGLLVARNLADPAYRRDLEGAALAAEPPSALQVAHEHVRLDVGDSSVRGHSNIPSSLVSGAVRRNQ